MKIVHFCLASFYIEGFGYQENLIPMHNKKDGHEVTVIASTETYINNKEIGYLQPCEYVNENGVKVIRLPYRKLTSHKIMRKIRLYPSVYKILLEEKPDVILFHGPQSGELLTVKKYKKNHPNVKLYVDNHADEGNSAKGFISQDILHKGYYKYILQKSLPYIDKVFYVTYERKLFLEKYYNVPQEKMEFYPLGGTVIEKEERELYRNEKRKELGFKDEDIVLVHAGKMDKLKRTIDIVTNFSKVNDDRLNLIIIGSFTDDVSEQIMPHIRKDKRIKYLGWKTADELTKYFCASDLYVQPGTHTVTMEHATCCSLPVIVANLQSYRFLLKNSKYSWIINDTDEMKEIFQRVCENPKTLKEMSQNAFTFAKEMFDYNRIAARLYR
ncbi:glycosyltransferase involved in cell wall biosynthesis [Peribacillus frigoritolerans]|uniref:glycosyltransferase family 4 protein n=1 Tax=Peribacillus frigoritolerans TaxID=450367 RepID=UPI00119BBF32|nr:glycosyltransferase family 4 protein [Peribacillus frigoritolerans]TWE04178.1 glycosyltransferase involved in cell wall biosynthesis [Peribacillus frigoritolerans]